MVGSAANEDLTINGKLYYSTGDISTADNDATGAILFNKKLVDDFSLPNPYEMVLDGSWTVDAMISMGKDVSSDLDGNSVWDKNDRYAAIIWDDTVMGVINSTGEKCATVKPDGRLELTLYNERVLSMFEKFTTAYYDTTQAYHYQRVSYDITDPVAMFANDQALFFMQLLDLVTYFRDMQTDFGILPRPEARRGAGQILFDDRFMALCIPLRPVCAGKRRAHRSYTRSACVRVVQDGHAGLL